MFGSPAFDSSKRNSPSAASGKSRLLVKQVKDRSDPSKRKATLAKKTKRTPRTQQIVLPKTLKAKDKELASRKATEPKVGEDFLELSNKVESKLNKWSKDYDILKGRLLPSRYADERAIPREVVNKVSRFVSKAVAVQQDLMASVVLNLKAAHKALAVIEQAKFDTEDETVQIIRENLNMLQKNYNRILDKDLRDINTQDLEKLRETMGHLNKAVMLLKEDPTIYAKIKINPEDKERFDRQLANSDEMMKLFNKSLKSLGIPEVGNVIETEEEVVIQVDKEPGIEEKIKKMLNDAMTEIKKADIKDRNFWLSITAVVGMVALALVLAAVLVGLLATGPGAIAAVVVLSLSAFISTFGAGTAAFTALYSTRSDVGYADVRKQLDEFLKLAPPLLEELKALEDSQKSKKG